MSDDWLRDKLIYEAGKAIYDVDTGPVTGEHFLTRPDHIQDLYKEWGRAALESLKVSTELLRWCDWPGCLRSFNVLTGPKKEVDGEGWMHASQGLRALLCPDHVSLGHWPGPVEWEPGWKHVNVSCECGERGEALFPSNHNAARTWWHTHIKELGL